MSDKTLTNKLANELSPYLLQHKNNPVEWYPWSDEAFGRAKAENKPVLLSIGYSTCHWCHVMERESFEDIEVAKLMNETFINIKVDREERPDVDHIYMTVCQMMTGAGGWPLTILMTPDKKPFFAGTYFPKHSRGERPGMIDLINRTREVWKSHQAELMEQAEEITEHLMLMKPNNEESFISESIFRKTFHELAGSYDEFNGGFGNRPKFPVPHNLLFLLRYYKRTGSDEALTMVVNTLTKMRLGGVYDHVGFGFHRYSTDTRWFLPHFEKMLYDQAMLLSAYSETYMVSQNELLKQTAYEITEYLERDLLAPEGAYYSAEDADSEGEEGKFYVWHIDEIRQLLIGNVEFATDLFGIEESGNFFDEATREKPGTNVLYLKQTLESYAKIHNFDYVELLQKANSIRQILLNERSKRIRPHLDDKILTDWNSLMISALCKAYTAFSDEKFLIYARRTYDFLRNNMFSDNYSLKHRYRAVAAGIDGMIDDYSFTIAASLDLFTRTAKAQYFEDAIKLTDYLIKHFSAPDGGFYFTSDLAEKLIIRKKEIYDGAIPSGNSVMLMNLVRLNRITGKSSYLDIADKMTKMFGGSVSSVPSAYTSFVTGLDALLLPTGEIFIVGTNADSGLFQKIQRLFLPNYQIILITDENSAILGEHVASLSTAFGEVTAYICTDFICSPPIHGEIEILNKLSEL